MAETRAAALTDHTEVGSYFVATYPPFSVWTADAVARDGLPALATPGDARVPLGVYLHIPFCRKRCHFCYFRVYTDKSSQDVGQYIDTIAREWELYAERPAVAGRTLDFVYFGGGTPSFLSTDQLQRLVRRVTATTSWAKAEEITFECEPGTLSEKKLAAIRELGVTRLSLGVESFDDRLLELNGRAHRSPEIGQAYRQARSFGFPQINIDLIAGMLGETDETWSRSVEKTIELLPDSVTIYQMELPYNTTISKDLLKGTRIFSDPVASWATKRRWVREAFESLETAGYTPRSAYTLVRDPEHTRFIYTDRLWEGADMVGLGVASFGHLNGVHLQNVDTWEAYTQLVAQNRVPLQRAYKPTPEERLIRELVLQLKRGSIRPAYFFDKYGVDVLDRFRGEFASLRESGDVEEAGPEVVRLTREGLLRIDTLLPRFFREEHRGIRYT